jgi:hypothetical protein
MLQHVVLCCNMLCSGCNVRWLPRMTASSRRGKQQHKSLPQVVLWCDSSATRCKTVPHVATAAQHVAKQCHMLQQQRNTLQNSATCCGAGPQRRAASPQHNECHRM